MRPHLAAIATRAAALDEAAIFPDEDVAVLRTIGLPMAPVPRALGGSGAGTEPEGAATIFGLLRMLGSANPAVGRLFEAHVNAVRLAMRFGTPAQREGVAAKCRAGGLFGLWVTDAPRQALRRSGGRLAGAKGPCSGAGHLRDALVTVTLDDGAVHMALAALSGTEPVERIGLRLHGMRAAANGTVNLDGVPLPDDAILGAARDYLREPDFSTGAWRTIAVTLGTLDTLVESVRTQLLARGHGAAPLQQARFGEMLVAQETSRLWTWQAAQIAEAGSAPVADQVAYVNLARIAVEAACFDVMRHAQRALGLAALVRPNPVERLLRDLATYLRQPAPDIVLTEAAQHAFGRA